MSLFAESREIAEGGKIEKVALLGLRTLVGRALVGRARMGPALMGWALMGRALMGTLGPYGLAGRASVGPTGARVCCANDLENSQWDR